MNVRSVIDIVKKKNTVIPSDECITVPICPYSVDILLRLLQCNVHIPVKTRQYSCRRQASEVMLPTIHNVAHLDNQHQTRDEL